MGAGSRGAGDSGRITQTSNKVEYTQNKDYIYHTKQYQTFYRKIKCDLFSFRGVQNRYYQDFQYLIVFINFFYELAAVM